MMTSSEALFDMATHNMDSAVFRLMIDMDTIKESSRKREIDGTAHIAGMKNPSDLMAKVTRSVKFLELMVGKKL